MSLRPKGMFLASILLALSPQISAQAIAATAGDHCFQEELLFDPELAPDQAIVETQKLRAAAELENAYAAYLLGTLYRHGPAHPAARLPQDPALADKWLRKSALRGNLEALSGLAELELSVGRSREALVLALVRAHYAGKFPATRFSDVRRFQSVLVNRAFHALGQPRSEALDTALLAEVNAFVANHGAQIEAGLKPEAGIPAPSSCPPFHDDDRWPLEYTGKHYKMAPKWSSPREVPGFASFVLVVNEKGRVDRAMVVDFTPDVDIVPALRKVAEGMRFNRLEGAPPRSGELPLVLW